MACFSLPGRRLRGALAGFAALSLFCGAALAFGQDRDGAPRSAQVPSLAEQANFEAPPPPRPKPIPSAQDRRRQYDADARELAKVMGAAHYLRWLCYGRRDQLWRVHMSELLEREDQRLRTALAEAFNVGFDTERERFDSCTNRAQASEVEWKAKGLKLADGLGARHRD